MHFDIFFLGRGNVLSHIVGAHGQFPSPAVDKHEELDFRGPAEAEERLDPRNGASARVQNVVA